MGEHLDWSFGQIVWMTLSLAVAACAAQLTFGWGDLKPSSRASTEILRLAGIGLTLGTGIWSTHAIATGLAPAPSDADVWIGTELSLWLLSGIASLLAALGWLDARRASLRRRLGTAFGLACSCLAVQVLGALSAKEVPAVSDWRGAALLGAWLVCVVASLAAFGLIHALRNRSPPARARGRAGVGLLIGGAILLSQHLVMVAAQVQASVIDAGRHDDVPSVASLLTSIAVLIVSRALLQRRRRAQSAQVVAHRKRKMSTEADRLSRQPPREV